MTVGVGASALGPLSTLGFALGGSGSVPTGQLNVGYGTWTATGTTAVSVVDANITANSLVFVALLTVGGTVGAIPVVKTKTAGTGFTVTAIASDTSVYGYIRVG